MAPRQVAAAQPKVLKHKRRFCRFPNCTRIVKSQGLCQRHGAKPRSCKVEGCTKQAQGNFDGMCKSHFKAHKKVTTPLPPKPEPAGPDENLEPPPPAGESVYDRILPASVAWHGSGPPESMPLIKHLKEGFDSGKPPAWHRNEERRARGLWPVHNPATQLEGWEREIVWMEILLLTGNPAASFRHLARGWGRDKGFQMVLSQFICERHGDVERKRRERMARDEKDVGVPSIWDDACYGDSSYNEALAADLFDFANSAVQNERAELFEIAPNDVEEESSESEYEEQELDQHPEQHPEQHYQQDGNYQHYQQHQYHHHDHHQHQQHYEQEQHQQQYYHHGQYCQPVHGDYHHQQHYYEQQQQQSQRFKQESGDKREQEDFNVKKAAAV